MAYPTVPVLSKTFTGNDADFNGNRKVAFKTGTGPEIVGEITMAAIIKIASWVGCSNGYCVSFLFELSFLLQPIGFKEVSEK
jgi:hypothetical protein